MNAIKTSFNFDVIPNCEFERKNNTIELRYKTKRLRRGVIVKYQRPFRVQKVLNQTLHLN